MVSQNPRPFMKTYKTNGGLWCGFSAMIFVTIGLVVRFDIKGDNQSLLRLIARSIMVLFTGRQVLSEVAFLAVWLGTWVVIAATIGWFLQSVAVVIFSRKGKKSKPTG